MNLAGVMLEHVFLKVKLHKAVWGCLLLVTTLTQSLAFAASSKKSESLYNKIAFIEGGDLREYTTTVMKGRDKTRQELWRELMDEVQKLAENGARVDRMIEPMAQILMTFNQMYDYNKAQDVKNVAKSLESAFKAQLLELYRKNNKQNPKLTLTSKAPLADLIAGGTFSTNDEGYGFIVNFDIASVRTGKVRSYTARGSLSSSMAQLAKMVFDDFEKNRARPLEDHQSKIQLVMPYGVMDLVGTGNAKKARQICRDNGLRLMTMTEFRKLVAIGAYHDGGGDLPAENDDQYDLSYVIADKSAPSNGMTVCYPRNLNCGDEYYGNTVRVMCVRD